MFHTSYCCYFLLLASSVLPVAHESEELSTLDIQLSTECAVLTTVSGYTNVELSNFFQIARDFARKIISPVRISCFLIVLPIKFYYFSLDSLNHKNLGYNIVG